MLKVFGAFVAAVLAILMKGLINLSLGEMLLILAIPFMFLYKVFGNKPAFLLFVGFFSGVLGAWDFIWGYIVIPIQYYYSLWGWSGVAAGVIATILLPFQLLLFFAVAFFKGGAAEYVGRFIAGVLFGITGLLLWISTLSASPWERFRRKTVRDAEA